MCHADSQSALETTQFATTRPHPQATEDTVIDNGTVAGQLQKANNPKRLASEQQRAREFLVDLVWWFAGLAIESVIETVVVPHTERCRRRQQARALHQYPNSIPKVSALGRLHTFGYIASSGDS